MLNILWEYWKNNKINCRHSDHWEKTTYLLPTAYCLLICGWFLLLAQPVLATPPLYPGMGGGHRDAVAPMHHRTTEVEGRLLAPGEWGIGDKVNTTGTVSIIVLLVEFNDEKFSENRAYFQGLMNEFVQYYHDNSYGKLKVEYAIATATITLTSNMGNYGGENDDGNSLIQNAVSVADKEVNFSNYDALMVIHAGEGMESNEDSTNIYSKFVPVNFTKVDNIVVHYACIVPEYEQNASPFGVFCHEFGHQLGLPDLYDTAGNSEGIGNWSLMASGAWNGSPQGSLPSYFDAWCKVKLDWVTPQLVTDILIHQSIPQAEINPVTYKLWNNTMDTKEYFLVENRQGAYLPGKGLLIWHIDDNIWDNNPDSNSYNTNPLHYMVALEQADGRRDLEKFPNPHAINRGDAGDPYPGNTSNRYFDNLSNPNSHTYSGVHTYISVENISNSSETMTADLSVFPPVMIAANGGTVTGRDGTTTLIFPEGAVSGTVSVYLFMQNEIEVGAEQLILSATDVGIATSTLRQVKVTTGQTVFAKPVIIQLPYSGTTTDMAIYRLTPDGRWEILPGTVSTTSHTIEAQVYCFSVFGVGPVANYIPPVSIISSVTNWPNPFVGGKESTNIYYVLKNATAIFINIYNPIGELVWSQKISAGDIGAMDGVNIVKWDGKNGEGEQVSQGIYFCVIEANGNREIRKIGVR